MIDRRQEKWAMVLDRGGKDAVCDLCGTALGTHMHEIISRGRTVKNPVARQRSFSRYICALLCGHCHQTRAHAPATARLLLQKNIDRYGYTPVRNAWDNVVTVLGVSTNIQFPGGKIE